MISKYVYCTFSRVWGPNTLALLHEMRCAYSIWWYWWSRSKKILLSQSQPWLSWREKNVCTLGASWPDWLRSWDVTLTELSPRGCVCSCYKRVHTVCMLLARHNEQAFHLKLVFVPGLNRTGKCKTITHTWLCCSAHESLLKRLTIGLNDLNAAHK